MLLRFLLLVKHFQLRQKFDKDARTLFPPGGDTANIAKGGRDGGGGAEG